MEIPILAVAFFAGTFGSILGIGGGIILVPVLTQFFNVDIKAATVVSLVSIVATSTSGAEKFLKSNLANYRIASFLEVGTVAGAITGFFLFGLLSSKSLYFIYAGFLFFSLVTMLRASDKNLPTASDSFATMMNFQGYIEVGEKRTEYFVRNSIAALLVMYFAGILSALLGIGSGILKVLAMDNLMKLPVKVSSATSNFMIGVTATASALAYYFSGKVSLSITPVVVIGIIFGAQLGSFLMPKMNGKLIRVLFVIILLVTAIQMTVKGLYL